MNLTRRIRNAHRRFLESTRALGDAQSDLELIPAPFRWLMELIAPRPLHSFSQSGLGLLSALQWLEANCHRVPLNLEAIARYHRLVSSGTPGGGGSYRIHKITLRDTPLRTSPPERIGTDMSRFEIVLLARQKSMEDASAIVESDTLTFGVEVHQRLAEIHPFPDGNGRVARLAMNHLLRRYGFGYVIFPPLNRSKQLWEAMIHAAEGSIEPLVTCARKYYHRI